MMGEQQTNGQARSAGGRIRTVRPANTETVNPLGIKSSGEVQQDRTSAKEALRENPSSWDHPQPSRADSSLTTKQRFTLPHPLPSEGKNIANPVVRKQQRRGPSLSSLSWHVHPGDAPLQEPLEEVSRPQKKVDRPRQVPVDADLKSLARRAKTKQNKGRKDTASACAQNGLSTRVRGHVLYTSSTSPPNRRGGGRQPEHANVESSRGCSNPLAGPRSTTQRGNKVLHKRQKRQKTETTARQ